MTTTSTTTTPNLSCIPVLTYLYNTCTLSELSGSCGDLGTFLPILAALAQDKLVYAAPVLFYAGAANVITGLAWKLPMPVQPMKSIAATALLMSESNWNAQTVTAAGIFMGILLTTLAVLPGDAITKLSKIIPRAVVSGMQVGVGIILALHGFTSLQTLPIWWNGKDAKTADCLALALVSAITTIASLPRQYGRRQVDPPPPIALYLFALASILALWTMNDDDNSNTTTLLSNKHAWFVPAWQDMTSQQILDGLWQGALPQLPLTLLNSVISVCCLADNLFAVTTAHNQDNTQQQVLSPRHVALSVGVLNLVACPLGAMPVCHGAGGLAGQYTFGARHGTSIVVLGIVKMITAMVAGPTRLVRFLQALPNSILGWLMAVAGHELAATGLLPLLSTSTVTPWQLTEITAGNQNNSDENETSTVTSTTMQRHTQPLFRSNVNICLWTAVVIVAFHKTHYGALVGCVVASFGSGRSRIDGLYRWCGCHCQGGDEAEATSRATTIPLTQEMV